MALPTLPTVTRRRFDLPWQPEYTVELDTKITKQLGEVVKSLAVEEFKAASRKSLWGLRTALMEETRLIKESHTVDKSRLQEIEGLASDVAELRSLRSDIPQREETKGRLTEAEVNTFVNLIKKAPQNVIFVSDSAVYFRDEIKASLEKLKVEWQAANAKAAKEGKKETPELKQLQQMIDGTGKLLNEAEELRELTRQLRIDAYNKVEKRRRIESEKRRVKRAREKGENSFRKSAKAHEEGPIARFARRVRRR